MNKINRILIVAIGDVAAQAVIEMKAAGNNFHVNGEPYSTDVRMDYMQFEDPSTYFNDLDKSLYEDTLLYFVINLSFESDIINYDLWEARAQSHYSVRKNFMMKRAPSLGNISDDIVEEITNAIKEANTSSDEEIAAQMPVDVPAHVPKKVIIAIGNHSCHFFGAMRLYHATHNESDLRFVPNRDDYHTVPVATDDILMETADQIQARHDDNHEYIILVDTELSKNDKPTAAFCNCLTRRIDNSALHFIYIDSYTVEDDPNHAIYRDALRTELNVSEDILQGEKSVKPVRENKIARKIILVYGYSAGCMLDSLRDLIDPVSDYYFICPVEFASTPKIDETLRNVKSFYHDKDEVYLVSDKNFLVGFTGQHLRNQLSAITRGNFIFTAVGNYHNLSSQYTRDKQLIQNELRAMNERIKRHNSNIQQKETKVNEQGKDQQIPFSWQQDLQRTMQQHVNEQILSLRNEIFSLHMQLSSIQQRVNDATVYGPGISKSFGPGARFPGMPVPPQFNVEASYPSPNSSFGKYGSAPYPTNTRVFKPQQTQGYGASEEASSVPYPTVHNFGFDAAYQSGREAKASNTNLHPQNGGRDFDTGNIQGTRSMHDQVRSPMQTHPSSLPNGLAPKRTIMLVYPNHHAAADMSHFFNKEIVSNPQLREAMSLIDIEEITLFEMVRGSGHEADDVIVIVPQEEPAIAEEVMRAINFTNTQVPEYSGKTIRRLGVLQFASYLTGLLTGFNMIKKQLTK